MVAEFRGPSPHDLGTAELATARFVDESVEVSLHLLDDWHRPMGPIIQVRMTPEVARSLAERLTAAAEARTEILLAPPSLPPKTVEPVPIRVAAYIFPLLKA